MSRFYQAYTDLPKLKQMLIDARQIAGHADGYMTIGDVVWRMFQNNTFRPEQNIRVWEDITGQIIGFNWYSPHRNDFEIQVHPHWRGKLEVEMLDWVLGVAQRHAPNQPLVTSSPDNDTGWMALLESRGYVRTNDESMYCNIRSLTEAIPPPPQNGFVLREVQSTDLEERVAAHRDVWYPSKVTYDAYINMRTQTDYDAELDLVAIVPNSQIVAYATAWLDLANKIGEFEPVGTRLAFQRQGYGKAVLLEGLQRMKTKGAETALVYCYEHNLPFYASVGFKPISKWFTYQLLSPTTNR
ncbi:MAG: GNAT family N-acetyltransferase [Chloroflexi bacterium]|nr:GNAT family N-acetyltransferase [Chloroflexota bacterium]